MYHNKVLYINQCRTGHNDKGRRKKQTRMLQSLPVREYFRQNIGTEILRPKGVHCTAARNQVLFPAAEQSRQGRWWGAEVRRGEKRGNKHKERCAEEEVVHDVTLYTK
jgi:hypothetical protein